METLSCSLQGLQTRTPILFADISYLHILSVVPLAALITANHKTTKLMICVAELIFIGIGKYRVQSKGTNFLVC